MFDFAAYQRLTDRIYLGELHVATATALRSPYPLPGGTAADPWGGATPMDWDGETFRAEFLVAGLLDGHADQCWGVLVKVGHYERAIPFERGVRHDLRNGDILGTSMPGSLA